ncbi:MAG TPA: hypothetical protein VMQ59_02425, partial [Acidimicrobiales bacterium]|nr:hypothetical protein [Acidimicrobiales bacterium]
MSTADQPHHWSGHLAPGTAAADIDLTAGVSLPVAWSTRWRAAPSARVLRDPAGGWVTGGELLDTTASVAGRLAGAGAQPGDRVLPP